MDAQLTNSEILSICNNTIKYYQDKSIGTLFGLCSIITKQIVLILLTRDFPDSDSRNTNVASDYSQRYGEISSYVHSTPIQQFIPEFTYENARLHAKAIPDLIDFGKTFWWKHNLVDEAKTDITNRVKFIKWIKSIYINKK